MDAFPNAAMGWKQESNVDPSYNCIAYAVGDTNLRWWPGDVDYFWPQNISQDNTVDAFVELFESYDYVVCEDGQPENDFEKIAIYATEEGVTHAARQEADGSWVSKLGENIDIRHGTVNIIEDGAYGKAVKFLKRRITSLRAV